MKKLFITVALSLSFTSSLFAAQVPCRFSVKSDYAGIKRWRFDGRAESILLNQGKEVTRKGDAHFEIYFTHDWKYADPLFGSFIYDRELEIEVYRNDGVVVHTEIIPGDLTRSNIEFLLEKLSKMKFKCADAED